MSEVKRYLIQKTPIGTMMKENPEGNWVAADDFDAQRLRADTAEAYAKAVSKSFDDIASIVGYSTERLGQTGESPMDCAEQIVAKLAAAEQRIAELVAAGHEMLRIAAIANQGSNAYNRAIVNLHAALNQKSEGESNE